MGVTMSNNKGFTMIQAMVTVAIMSIIALGLAQMLNNVLLASQTADQKLNVNSLVASTAGVASNTVTCTQAITIVSQVYNPDTIEFNGLKANIPVPTHRLTVSSLSYLNPTLVQTGFDGTTVYHGDLSITLTSNIPVYGPQTFAPRPVMSIYITVSPSNTITGCGTIMPALPEPPLAPPMNPDAQAAPIKTITFDADPKNCENFPVEARCPGQKIVVTESSYGQNCGIAPNNALPTVQGLCNGQASCSFTAGNIDNCSGSGVFVDPAVGCAKSYHMSYYCK